MKKGWLAVQSFMVLTMVTACGSPGTKPENTAGEKSGEKSETAFKIDPAALKVFIEIPGMTDEEWNKYITVPVQKKYPQISFEIVRPAQGQTLNDLITAGNTPDLIYGGPAQSGRVDLQYPLDLREQFKKHHIDISTINPVLMDSIKQLGDNGQIYGVPFTQTRSPYGITKQFSINSESLIRRME